MFQKLYPSNETINWIIYILFSSSFCTSDNEEQARKAIYTSRPTSYMVKENKHS